MWHEEAGFRAVHACWDPAAIGLLRRTLPEGRLRAGDWDALAEPGSPLTSAVETVLKGPELPLPGGRTLRDVHGNERREERVRWWALPPPRTWREARVGHWPDWPGDEPFPTAALPGGFYPGDEKPVFFGHYALRGSPGWLTPNAGCLDYGVAAGGALVGFSCAAGGGRARGPGTRCRAARNPFDHPAVRVATAGNARQPHPARRRSQPMAITQAKLDENRHELLDLSARNRLLSIPVDLAQARLIHLHDERSADLCRMLVVERKAFTFVPLKAGRPAAGDPATPAGPEGVALPQPDGDLDPESGKSRRHTDTRLQTTLRSETLQSRLLGLYRDARTLVEEQGVNTLYLALGQLRWFAPD